MFEIAKSMNDSHALEFAQINSSDRSMDIMISYMENS